MRGFFALLLLTNVGLFAWQYWLARESTNAIPGPYAGMVLKSEGLKLISELPQEQRPSQRALVSVDQKAERSRTVEEEKSEPQSRPANDPRTLHVIPPGIECYQSSLLADLDEAKILQARISKLGLESLRRTVETTKVNYWVKLNPYSSRAKANEAVEILSKNRIKDIFIVRSGRHENAVSLGVFSTRERAEQRYKEISELKGRIRKPVIEALELPAKRLVVELRLAQEEIPQGFSALLDSEKQPHLKKISCNR